MTIAGVSIAYPLGRFPHFTVGLVIEAPVAFLGFMMVWDDIVLSRSELRVVLSEFFA